jgi:hypothetical protein
VVDVSPPAVSILADNPFTQGAWVSGTQTVNYDAWDNVGVKRALAGIGGVLHGAHERECNYASTTPCVNGAGAITVDTKGLPEGSQALTVDALDAADNVGPSNPVTVRLDNTAPGAVAVDVEGGPVWRNQNSFDLAWANADEGDRAPITAAHYRICRAAGTDCGQASRPGTGIAAISDLTVPGPGEWQLTMWREDAANNHEPANASVPVTLRFDPEPPELAFEELTPSDPTLVSVAVTDKVSGLASGQIELSRQGSGTWQTLATQQQDSRLLARLDDSLLPAGVYLLRATAWDQASNQNSTDRRIGGELMAVTLPLRIPTAVRAGVVTKRTVRRSIERRGKRRTVRRRVVELRNQAQVRFGERLRISGRLENRDGQPIPNAEVQVFSRSATTPEQLVGIVSTDGDGRYTYEALADATRTLRFVYAGTPVMLPAQGEVTLLTSAASEFRASPRRLNNGQSVRFSGRLQSLPAPPAGKLVELQVVLSGRWQTFRTTRTRADGQWVIRYRFRRTCGLLRYRFRARLPAEAGYTFQTGRTRALTVRVRGGRCR